MMLGAGGSRSGERRLVEIRDMEVRELAPLLRR